MKNREILRLSFDEAAGQSKTVITPFIVIDDEINIVTVDMFKKLIERGKEKRKKYEDVKKK